MIRHTNSIFVPDYKRRPLVFSFKVLYRSPYFRDGKRPRSRIKVVLTIAQFILDLRIWRPIIGGVTGTKPGVAFFPQVHQPTSVAVYQCAQDLVVRQPQPNFFERCLHPRFSTTTIGAARPEIRLFPGSQLQCRLDDGIIPFRSMRSTDSIRGGYSGMNGTKRRQRPNTTRNQAMSPK